MAEQNSKLLMAATGCVKAAGECVAKTKFVIERIGDFEFEPETQGLGVHLNAIGLDFIDRDQTDASRAGKLHYGSPRSPTSAPTTSRYSQLRKASS